MRELLGVRAVGSQAAAEEAQRPERGDLSLRPTLSPLSTGGPGNRSSHHRGTVLRAPRPARLSPLRRRLLPSSFPRCVSPARAFPARLRHRGRHG